MEERNVEFDFQQKKTRVRGLPCELSARSLDMFALYLFYISIQTSVYSSVKQRHLFTTWRVDHVYEYYPENVEMVIQAWDERWY